VVLIIYKVLLLIHGITALIGIGQTFLIPLVLFLPKSGKQIRFALNLLKKIGIIASVSDYILFLTGLWMLFYLDYQWNKAWLNLAIILFFLMRINITVFCKKYVQKVYAVKILDDEFPSDYHIKVKELMYPLSFTQGLVLVILCLMILKPNFPLSYLLLANR